MTTDDALSLINKRIDPDATLSLVRVISLGGEEVPEHQRGGWIAATKTPFSVSRPLIITDAWGETPQAAAAALLETLT